MKTLLVIAATLVATSASADTVRATIKDHYTLQEVSVPTTQTFCRNGSAGWEETTYHVERTEVYSHSTITFKQNGQTYSFEFYK